MNIFVGNLSFRLSEDELSRAFEAFGEVQSARIITDRETGRSRGFGFVVMSDDSEGQTAIDNLNGSELNGREMRVNVAIDKQR
ncbi:MAG: RNA-binding protein [Schleiferiaceae bacterium]|jgi:RNA recognition motif-containing protein